MAGKIREEIVRCFNTHITSELQPKAARLLDKFVTFQYPYNERVATFHGYDSVVKPASFNTHITSELQPILSLKPEATWIAFQYPYNERVATIALNCKIEDVIGFNTHITSKLQPCTSEQSALLMSFNTHITSELQLIALWLYKSSPEFQYPYNERVAT